MSTLEVNRGRVYLGAEQKSRTRLILATVVTSSCTLVSESKKVLGLSTYPNAPGRDTGVIIRKYQTLQFSFLGYEWSEDGRVLPFLVS